MEEDACIRTHSKSDRAEWDSDQEWCFTWPVPTVHSCSAFICSSHACNMNIAHVHMQPIVSLILGYDYVIIIIHSHLIRLKCLVKILHLKPAKGLPYGVKWCQNTNQSNQVFNQRGHVHRPSFLVLHLHLLYPSRVHSSQWHWGLLFILKQQQYNFTAVGYLDVAILKQSSAPDPLHLLHNGRINTSLRKLEHRLWPYLCTHAWHTLILCQLQYIHNVCTE